MLYTSVASDGASITARDFRDNRSVPDNYTFGQYHREKLPLLSSLLPQLRDRQVQDTVVRFIAIDKVNEMIEGNQRLINEAPKSNGGLAALAENPVLNQFRQNLIQKTSPPVGVRSV